MHIPICIYIVCVCVYLCIIEKCFDKSDDFGNDPNDKFTNI